MTATRPDSDPANETTPVGTSSLVPTTLATQSTSSVEAVRSVRTSITNSPESLSLVSISAIPTLSTSLVSSSMTTSLAGSSSSTSSASISWGPAITASALPGAATSSDTDATSSSASPIPTVRSQSDSSSGFSKSAEDITISISVIGGVFILALLIYAILRRRRGATVSEIVRFRRHYPSTIMLSPTPRDARLTALPIYRESRYSVRSSKHASVASFPWSLKRTAPVPVEVAQRFHHHNPYVKNQWKTAHTPSAPRTPLREAQSSVDVVMPAMPEAKDPEKSRPTTSGHSTRSRMTQQSSDDTTKSRMMITVAEQVPSESGTKLATPPDTPTSQQNLQERWSWTNSQAPATPRMYAPSLRSSISSLPRFKTIKSWVRGQTERIAEEDRPPTSRTLRLPSLKNKASLPKLGPPVTRKLSKSRPDQNGRHGRTANPSSSSMPRPGTKVPAPTSPRVEEQRPVTAPAMEMRQLSR